MTPPSPPVKAGDGNMRDLIAFLRHGVGALNGDKTERESSEDFDCWR